jgi:hypothetical protein
VRSSIIGRMERHGGTARIRRREDGTEIELCLPVAPPPTTASANGLNGQKAGPSTESPNESPTAPHPAQSAEQENEPA